MRPCCRDAGSSSLPFAIRVLAVASSACPSGRLNDVARRLATLRVDPLPDLVLLDLEGAREVPDQIANQHAVVLVVVALGRMDVADHASLVLEHDEQWLVYHDRFIAGPHRGSGQE